MLLDFRSVEANRILEADLCIVGAGAAGITIAREFVGTSIRVLLVESGGLNREAPIQALNKTKNVGFEYRNLDESRLRYFGGTTNHWNGFCRPLDPSDFEARPWVAHSGWPLRPSALEPFLRRAETLCELPVGAYEQVWDQGERPALDAGKLAVRAWQLSPPTRFGAVYRRALVAAANIAVLHHATAVRIEAEPANGTITGIALAELGGKRGRVRARRYVIACGGVENPRLLLLSSGAEANGIGNRHGLVGRFYSEHLYSICALVLAGDNPFLPEPVVYRGGRFRLGFGTSEPLQRREQVLNCAGYLDIDQDRPELFPSEREPPTTARLPIRAYIIAQTEQAPTPDSRVSLDVARDALGVPMPRLDWRFGALEKASVTALVRAAAEEFGRLGLGRVVLSKFVLDHKALWGFVPGDHHMGTTRMSDDPRRGVVDPDCRVHFYRNLFVAGSSVFPAYGAGNPTLTLVALALRLADHLKADIAGRQ